jgi:hypothetical protein
LVVLLGVGELHSITGIAGAEVVGLIVGIGVALFVGLAVCILGAEVGAAETGAAVGAGDSEVTVAGVGDSDALTLRLGEAAAIGSCLGAVLRIVGAEVLPAFVAAAADTVFSSSDCVFACVEATLITGSSKAPFVTNVSRRRAPSSPRAAKTSTRSGLDEFLCCFIFIGERRREGERGNS